MATQVNMSGGFYVGAVMVFLLGLVFGLIGRAVCRSAKLKNPHIAWGKVGLVFSWMGIVCTVGVIIPAILVVRAALRRA